jgi:hypothetical protein
VEKQGIRGDSIRVQKQLLPELDCKRSTAGIAKSLKSSGCFPDSLLERFHDGCSGIWQLATETSSAKTAIAIAATNATRKLNPL